MWNEWNDRDFWTEGQCLDFFKSCPLNHWEASILGSQLIESPYFRSSNFDSHPKILVIPLISASFSPFSSLSSRLQADCRDCNLVSENAVWLCRFKSDCTDCCLIVVGALIWGYQKFYSIPKNWFLASNRPNWAQNWHFWLYLGIFGPFDPIPDQKNNANKLPWWFFRYMGTKTFTYSHKN